MAKKKKSLYGGRMYDQKFWGKESDGCKNRLGQRTEAFKGVIELLQFACIYDFESTKDAAENFIEYNGE